MRLLCVNSASIVRLLCVNSAIQTAISTSELIVALGISSDLSKKSIGAEVHLRTDTSINNC